MGLLDRNKRKATPAPQPAPGSPAATAAATNALLAAPLVSSVDSESLRDMLIATLAAQDAKLFASLATANRKAIAENFGEWQKVPEPVRNNGGAMQRYANTLIKLAEMFRDEFGDASLIDRLRGPAQQNNPLAPWERGLAQAETLAKELRYDQAKDLLGHLVMAIADYPIDGPVPVHAVTHGRLAHTLFSMGDVDAAIEQMSNALRFSEQRNDDQGIAAALRGIYEIRRYQGRTAEAADLAARVAAQFAKLNNPTDAEWWTKQSARVRAGEPLCRVVFFINDQQCEVDEVPQLNEGRVRYGFVRNRPPLSLCEGLVQRGMELGSQAKFDEALSTFNEAAGIDPYDPNPHYQSAVTLMHLQRPADAVAAYDTTEKLGPGWFNERSERWVAAEILAGRLDPAIFFILRTEEMPDQSATWEQKLSLAEQAIGRAGEIPPLLLYRSRCLMRLGRAGDAEPILRSALEKATEPDIRTRLLVDLQMIIPDEAEKRRLLTEAATLNGNLAAGAVARVALKQLGA